MKKILFTSSFFLLFSLAFAQLKVEQYTLENGFRVILNPDKTINDVFGAIAVNTGSKNDPIDATGMSHYLEHLLFKGTTELGTSNYSAEKTHLDSIVYLYDEMAKTTDKKLRAEFQSQINQQALKASQYSMPNEYDKLLKSMGSTGVNATTSNDLTIYFNSFPSHQINKWMDLQAHRFGEPVFRSFQSELEVVYEEKNRAMDNMERRLFEAFSQNFYAGHPYGEKGTLGTVEHLKNPSLSKMYAYYKKYYVANNMCLILTGNFDPQAVKPEIEKYFTKLKSADFEKPKIEAPAPLKGKTVKNVRITPVKVGLMGFRTVPRMHPDELALDLASALLQNESGTGLIDQIQRDEKVMKAWSFSEMRDETGHQVFIYVPKILIQSFSSAEKQVLGVIDRLKNGDFSEEQFLAVKNELYMSRQLSLENPKNRGYFFANLFRLGKSYDDVSDYTERLKAIKKEDVVAVAKQYFGEDYFVLHSRTGFGGKEKLDKPDFKALKIDQEKESAYAKHFNALPEEKVKSRYLDFEKDLTSFPLGQEGKIYVVKNPLNDIYSLNVQFHYGSLQDSELEVLAAAMNLAAPKGRNQQNFKRQIALLGCTYRFAGGSNYFSLELEGIEENLSAVIKEMNALIQNPELTETAWNVLVNDFKINRKSEEEQALSVARAMAQFGLYGEQSPIRNRPSLKQIEKMNKDDVILKMKTVNQSALTVHFAGQMNPSTFKKAFESGFQFNGKATKTAPVDLEIAERTKNEIFLINNKKLLQANIFIVQKASSFSSTQYPKVQVFNNYFSGGFSGILTQEVREYRSLAYTSSAKYQFSYNPKNSNYFYTYVACQADKTNEAVELVYNLLRDMPKKPERLNGIKRNVTLSQNSTFPSFRNLSSRVDGYLIQGYSEDPNRFANAEYRKITFDDLYDFYRLELKNKHSFIGIYGDLKRIDIKSLEKIGTVDQLKKSDVIAF